MKKLQTSRQTESSYGPNYNNSQRRNDPAAHAAGGRFRRYQRQQKKAFAGADTVTLTVESALPLDFQLGDKIVAFSGETYTLNALAPVKKIGPRRFNIRLLWRAGNMS